MVPAPVMTLEERMAKFRVSPTFGFVVEKPAMRLSERYNVWHDFCDGLPALIESDPASVRPKIEAMPVIEIMDRLSYEEQRLAHGILCTMVSAYLFAYRSTKRPNSIPRSLSLPLYRVSLLLGVSPVVSHPCSCLCNWKRIKNESDTTNVNADDLDMIYFKFIRDDTNVWFFVLTLEIEFRLAPAIRAVANICHLAAMAPALVTDAALETAFGDIIAALGKSGALFERFKERMTPTAYYHGLRPYLWGYGKIEGGVTFEGLEHLGPQKHGGASAAQSCSLQTLDAFLGAVHRSKETGEFMQEQRGYMPRENRQFVEWIEKVSKVPAVRAKITAHPKLADAIDALHEFRSSHLQAVALFILTQTKDHSEAGTGGSNLMNFLKTVRDEADSVIPPK